MLPVVKDPSLGVCDMFFREKYPYKEFHRHLHQQEPWSKKTLRNLYKHESEIFGTEILQIVFWNFAQHENPTL